MNKTISYANFSEVENQSLIKWKWRVKCQFTRSIIIHKVDWMFCCINVIFGAKLIIIWNLIYCFAAFLGAIVFWFDLNPDHPGINNFDIFALLPKHNAIWYIKHRKTAGIFFGFIFTMNSGMMIYWFFVGVMCLKTKFNRIYTERFFFSYFT